ncbi:hypothetical protein [Notoacmeibacter sp. MSK16QG-6]|uniref:hypothetical protein n=1 Tax=Notoacmeibacter sp. MSK16QG-6 TaxID=2957982 RepID=UPI00209EC4BC|nr:hypothetical protein [Notoacmeibacter sp. MSK16QG-6]MCP1198565.1 hypothetical protein [Notoacmeibacter sp. MSK16QG-6]
MSRFDDSRSEPVCPAETYLARPAERLVVEGYRNSLSGCATGEVSAWRGAWSLYLEDLGETDGRIAFDGLVGIIGTLGRCARCPLRFFNSDIRHLCRDEGLLLALIAAAQHGDEQTGQIAAQALSCPLRCGELTISATDYALRLRMVGRTLLPVSAAMTASLAERGGPPSPLHRSTHRTLH